MVTKREALLGLEQRPAGMPTYQQLLDSESNAVADVHRLSSQVDLGDDPLPVERWTSQAFADREMRGLWPNVWQIACRADQIAKVGDFIVYDIGDYSFLVVRVAEDIVRAYHNYCRHRGRRLRATGGHTDSFRCPFHGFTWRLDGTASHIPCLWDFPQIDKADLPLDEVRAGQWRGFVFIAMSASAPGLDSYLDGLDPHFAQWDVGAKYTRVHLSRRIPANWKVGLEAFLEAYHTLAVHPQMAYSAGDLNAQYDIFPGRDHFNRMMVPLGVASPHLAGLPGVTEQAIIDSMIKRDRVTDDVDSLRVPEGATARAFIAARARHAEADVADRSSATDAEMIDPLAYSIFPNVILNSGHGTSNFYRFRPDGTSPDMLVMDVMLLSPCPGDGPPPPGAKEVRMRDDERFSEREELGLMGPVLDQDLLNMPEVQRGMKAARGRRLHLARYQESRIRHYHHVIDKYLAMN